jgi:hypothetical protein
LPTTEATLEGASAIAKTHTITRRGCTIAELLGINDAVTAQAIALIQIVLAAL